MRFNAPVNDAATRRGATYLQQTFNIGICNRCLCPGAALPQQTLHRRKVKMRSNRTFCLKCDNSLTNIAVRHAVPAKSTLRSQQFCSIRYSILIVATKPLAFTALCKAVPSLLPPIPLHSSPEGLRFHRFFAAMCTTIAHDTRLSCNTAEPCIELHLWYMQ